MSNYKLLSMQPTPEMIEAAEEAYMPFGDMDLAVRMAILAAPVVQVEPVGWQFYYDGKWWNGDDRIKDHKKNTEEVGFLVRDVYAAPQPAEQQPLKSSLALDAATHLTNWLGMDLCECEGGHTCGYNEVQRTRDALLAVALIGYLPGHRNDITDAAISQCEQVLAACPDCAGSGKAEHSITVQESDSAAPDAAQLAEALESAKNLIANHSGEVLPDKYAGDQIEQIDAAIAELEKRNG